MRKVSTVILLPCMMSLAAACGTDYLEVESEAAGLSIAYVSGHLGTESACPVLTQELRIAVCPETGCEPSPCDNGAVLVRVKNIVDHKVPVRLDRILLVAGGETQALTVREIATTDGQRLSELDAEREATLRILFPKQQINSGSGTGSLQLSFSGEDGEALEIITPELQLVPPVVT